MNDNTEDIDNNTKQSKLVALIPGVKKQLIVKAPIIFLRNGLVSIGSLLGYGTSNARIYRPPLVKNITIQTQELINQTPKLYVNKEDPNDVVILTQAAIDVLKKGIDLSVEERKAKL